MEKLKAVIGIDPGKKGALGLFAGLNSKIDIKDYPNSYTLTYEILNEWVNQFNVQSVVLEKVGVVVFGGKKAAFGFGENSGFYEGLLIAMKLPYCRVLPREWQKVVDNKSGRTSKERSLNTAQKLFPYYTFKKTKDGRADAILMAYYGWSRLL